MSEDERQFKDAMLEIYRRAKEEAGYNATRFLHMVGEQGALSTAHYLIHSSTPSDGYTELHLRGRLDLTVEAEILKPKWEKLFSEEDRNAARKRLALYGYPLENA